MKIALLGSQTHSTELAPFEDKSWERFRQGMPAGWPIGGRVLPEQWTEDEYEIWACSPGAAVQLRRCTRFFELHRFELGKPWFSIAYVEFLRNFKGPVYTGGPIPEFPTHVLYPIERVEHEFSSYFLTSSLALMCALAILEIEDDRRKRSNGESDDVIGFWGVDMSAVEEHGYQRAGCQHFILEALRRGIGIYVPPESCLLRPVPVYGLSEWNATYIKLTQRAREINARREDAEKQLQQAQAQLQYAAGAMEDLNYVVNTWTSPFGLPPGMVIRMEKPDGIGARRDPGPADKDVTGGDQQSRRERRDNREGAGPSQVAAEPRQPD